MFDIDPIDVSRCQQFSMISKESSICKNSDESSGVVNPHLPIDFLISYSSFSLIHLINSLSVTSLLHKWMVNSFKFVIFLVLVSSVNSSQSLSVASI